MSFCSDQNKVAVIRGGHINELAIKLSSTVYVVNYSLTSKQCN